MFERKKSIKTSLLHSPIFLNNNDNDDNNNDQPMDFHVARAQRGPLKGGGSGSPFSQENFFSKFILFGLDFSH